MPHSHSAGCGVRGAEFASQPFRIPHSAFRIGERGSILLYVVWMVILLSLFTAGVGSRAIFALGLSARLSEELQTEYIARGAAHYALSMLQNDSTPTVDGLKEQWSDDPNLLSDRPLLGGSFSLVGDPRLDGGARFGLTDEERRLNLNTAPGDVLQGLVEAIGGATERDALEIAAAIEDWRDQDDDERPHGAEGIYYRSLRNGYDCKDGPFENLEELLLIRGVSAEIFRTIEPYVTVYGSGSLNLNTASPQALSALGLSPAGVSGFRAFRAGEDGAEETDDDRRLVAVGNLESELKDYVSIKDIARLSRLAQAGFLSVRSLAFRTTIHVVSDHPASRMTVQCVMDRSGAVKLWDEQ